MNLGLGNLEFAVPEIFLACAAMLLLMVGVFRREGAATGPVSWLGVAILVVTAVLVLVFAPQNGSGELLFAKMFRVDFYRVFMKILILAASAVGLIMAENWNEREGINRFEFPVLILLATLGMMMMVSANDLIALYVGLELQSLSLYVVAAFRRDSVKSSEAGLKYFVLGALASGMLLYGASMVYGFWAAAGRCRRGLSSVSSSSWSDWPSRYLPFPSTCGPRTCMRGRRPRSPPISPRRPRWRRWRCWSPSWSGRSASLSPSGSRSWC